MSSKEADAGMQTISRPLKNDCLVTSCHLKSLPLLPALNAAPDFENQVRRENSERKASSHSSSVLCTGMLGGPEMLSILVSLQ